MEINKMVGKKNIGLSKMNKRKMKFAYVLLIPFFIGFFLFFLQPLILSLIYSFSTVDLLSGGKTTNVGWQHFNKAVFIVPEFKKMLFLELSNLLSTAPMVVIFSLFVATLLNKEFKGRLIARIILFLPVIITTGVMLSIESSDYLLGSVSESVTGNTGGAVKDSGIYETDFFNINSIVMNLKLPQEIMGFLKSIIDNFYIILVTSGVQITLLLASLQSIPNSLYEASSIEGATAWENFWMITLPMISPYIFVCTFYTIIDTFVNPLNSIVGEIRRVANDLLDYGYSSALAWIYFVVIAVVLIIVGLGFYFSKNVFYYDK